MTENNEIKKVYLDVDTSRKVMLQMQVNRLSSVVLAVLLTVSLKVFVIPALSVLPAIFIAVCFYEAFLNILEHYQMSKFLKAQEAQKE